jgi:hypothetical protein
MSTASPVSYGARAVGFKREKETKFDDAISKIMDATQVAGCQLLDEVIRDLQETVSKYNIPSDASCVEFYSWLDNAAAESIGQKVSAYQTILVGLGLGAVPDNMGDQLTALRDALIGVIRAAFNPVCANPSTTTLTKEIIQARLKQLQGLLCASKGAGAESVWPKLVKNADGSSTIVTADGTSISMNLDNSADNTSNIANMYEGGSGSSSKLDPNVLAALLIAGSSPGGLDPARYNPLGAESTQVPTETPAPETLAPAVIDSSVLDAIDLQPVQVPVQTIFGLGPIGITLVAIMIIAIICIWWYLAKNKAKPAVAVSVAAAAAPAPAATVSLRNSKMNDASRMFEGLSGILKK